MGSSELMTDFALLLTISMSLVFGAPLGEAEVTVNATKKCPRIVSRLEWGAREACGHEPMAVSPVPYVVAHHGGVPHYCHDEDTCASIVRAYQNLHMDTHGWMDIGYHFVIGGDGNVYEGRGWDYYGAHAPGYNGQGIGVCIIGDYSNQLPNNASLNAFRLLIDCGISLGKIRSDYKLIGHRQGRNTECPGNTYYQFLKTWSHWTENPTPMVSKNKSTHSLVRKTFDITGTKLWYDLIALGNPEMDTDSKTGEMVTEAKMEENLVDTGNSVVRASD